MLSGVYPSTTPLASNVVKETGVFSAAATSTGVTPTFATVPFVAVNVALDPAYSTE